MTFITFIYKVGNNNKTYYGKYCVDYISDDHEGLDNEVKYALLKGLNEYKKQNYKHKIKSKIIIGVLSFSTNDNIQTYSSNDEIKCFNFYHDYNNKIYINGKIIFNF